MKRLLWSSRKEQWAILMFQRLAFVGLHLGLVLLSGGTLRLATLFFSKLCNNLKNMIDSIVLQNQSCCVPGRSIFDHFYLFLVRISANIKWVELLYTEISICIIVNGQITSELTLHRCVRQGFSISPVCLLSLGPAIRNCNKIYSIQKPGLLMKLHQQCGLKINCQMVSFG